MLEKISPGANATWNSPIRCDPTVVITVGPDEAQLRAVVGPPFLDQWYSPGTPAPGVPGVNSRSNIPTDANVVSPGFVIVGWVKASSTAATRSFDFSFRPWLAIGAARAS